MDMAERFWNSNLLEMKKGYIEDETQFTCLLCGTTVEKGMIYPENGALYESERYMVRHIEQGHGSVFEYLIQLDKKFTGLTDHQTRLLRLFYEGNSDAQIKEELGIGSASTIRNHRFVLKEKERQAKVFLTLMDLLQQKDQYAPKFVAPHKTATMVDDRYNVTEEESQAILQKYLPSGHLKTFDLKQKQRFVVLREIATYLQPGLKYTEHEINEILEAIYEDYVTIRRYLIDYGFLDRKPDGSEYWLKENSQKGSELSMNRREELKQMYKEIKTEAGVYQIKNRINQKTFVASTRNLKTLNGKKFQLQMGGNPVKELQQDWKEYGEEAFDIEVLEVLKKPEEGYFDEADALKKLEEKWLNQLQPYGERGYNKPKPQK